MKTGKRKEKRKERREKREERKEERRKRQEMVPRAGFKSTHSCLISYSYTIVPCRHLLSKILIDKPIIYDVKSHIEISSYFTILIIIK